MVKQKLQEKNYFKKKTDKFYLIRLSKLFGKPAIAEGAKKSFIDMMIWLATEGEKDHLDLVDEENSSPTYAPDLAKFTRKILEEKRIWNLSWNEYRSLQLV